MPGGERLLELARVADDDVRRDRQAPDAEADEDEGEESERLEVPAHRVAACLLACRALLAHELHIK
jgi:hypothetical protein